MSDPKWTCPYCGRECDGTCGGWNGHTSAETQDAQRTGYPPRTQEQYRRTESHDAVIESTFFKE